MLDVRHGGSTPTAVSELLCGSVPMVIMRHLLSRANGGNAAVGTLTSGLITPLLSHAADG
jgi:hypothetical protein